MANLEHPQKPIRLDATLSFVGLALFIGSLVSSSALASVCRDLFQEPTQAERSALHLDLQPRLDFRKVLPSDQTVLQVVSDESGRYMAIVSVTSDRSLHPTVRVVDLISSKVIFTDRFESLKTIQFMDDTDLLAVSATREKDGQKHQLYLLDYLRAERPQRLMGPAPEPDPSITPRSSLSLMSAMTWWLPAVTSRGSIVAKPEVPQATGPVLPESLPLPQSISWGVSAEQVISRSDLPYAFVVQRSSNSREVHHGFSVMNKGLDIFDAGTRAHLGSLTFGDLVPEQASLNPRSSLMALHLVDPTGRSGKNSIVLVDAKNPHRILFAQDFGQASFTIRSGDRSSKVVIGKILKTQWSPDGRHLMISERQTGSLVSYDVELKKVERAFRAPTQRWPLAGGFFLDNDRYLAIRIGDDETGIQAKTPSSLNVVIVPVGGPLDMSLMRGFRLKVADVREDGFRTVSDSDSVVSGFSMKNGSAFVVAFRNQMILVDLENPEHGQTVLRPMREGLRANLSSLTSVRKVSEDTLEVTDRQHGVFDLTMP